MDLLNDVMLVNKMEKDDFYAFMKVYLNGERGVVTEQFSKLEGEYTVNGGNCKGVASKLYGVIRWDTNKEADFEDWRGLWGTFIELGGKEIQQDYQFQFINNDGTYKNK